MHYLLPVWWITSGFHNSGSNGGVMSVRRRVELLSDAIAARRSVILNSIIIISVYNAPIVVSRKSRI